MAQVFKLLKSASSNILPPKRPHLLDLPKQYQQMGTKCPNGIAMGYVPTQTSTLSVIINSIRNLSNGNLLLKVNHTLPPCFLNVR